MSKFDFGQIGLKPLSQDWGYSRGRPVDRRYIDEFMARNAEYIRGNVLEVGDRTYTHKFGGSHVTKSDVLDIRPRNPQATYIADLVDASNIPSDTFDCFILTQVYVLIRQIRMAIAETFRIIKPGGVALITMPGISQISPLPQEAREWSWSLYPNSLSLLLQQGGFHIPDITIESYGNLRTTVAFLAGLAQQDIDECDYSVNDPCYPLIVTARAFKPLGAPRSSEGQTR